MINEILKTKTYPEFKKQLAAYDCQECALGAGRANLVVDRGNYRSDTMIIGEAPGKDEDEQGKPFVGRSGKLMNQLLIEQGFDTNQDALVANIAKCRPPNNRPPTIKEATQCKSYLFKQIELMQPKYILLMGRTAVKHILPHLTKVPMNTLVQNSYADEAFPNTRFFIFFHPAYILRDPRKKPLMQQLITHFLQQKLPRVCQE